MRGADEVRLDRQVLVEEVGAQRVVCVDAADARRGDEDVVGALLLHEVAHGALLEQVELAVRAQEQLE